jgi:putative MATE family efflux protein
MSETNVETDIEERDIGKKLDMSLTEGNLWSAIWIMSWPLLLTTVAHSLVGMVDVQVAGMLGSTTQAAVGLAEQVLFLFMIFLMSLGVGTTALVARAYGEKKIEEVNHFTGQSLALSIIIGLVLTVVAVAGANFLLPLFSGTKEIVDAGAVYLAIYGLYLVPFSLICIANAAFRAIGDAKTPLLIVTAEVVVNIIGDYATVVGNWPVPGLGIRGIAYSAIVGAIIGSAIAIYRLYTSPLKDSVKYLTPISGKTLHRLLDIGIPSAFQRLGWAGSTFALFFILSKLKDPTAALAAWTIGIRVEGILFMPLVALSLAVGSIVGQNLGANQNERAIKAGWHVTGIGVVMMLVLSTAVYVFAPQLADFMSDDPATITHTASYLQINALAEPFLAVNMILSGGLQGAGDTKIPMWISLFCNWIVRLPLAWYLAITIGQGPLGAWIAMSTSIAVSAFMIAYRFQTGTWIKTRV